MTQEDFILLKTRKCPKVMCTSNYTGFDMNFKKGEVLTVSGLTADEVIVDTYNTEGKQTKRDGIYYLAFLKHFEIIDIRNKRTFVHKKGNLYHINYGELPTSKLTGPWVNKLQPCRVYKLVKTIAGYMCMQDIGGGEIIEVPRQHFLKAFKFYGS